MANFFNQILYRPIFNALVVIYQYAAFRDLGLAIILLTVLIRLILWPLFHETARFQKIAPKLQSRVKQIQERHKDDREKQTLALLELYREHNLNMFTPILALIVQLPLLIALYGAMSDVLSYKTSTSLLYSFVPHPAAINLISFGIIDLSKVNIVIILVAGVLQYLTARLALPEREKGMAPTQAEQTARMMTWLGPTITLVILAFRPAALGLYWCTFATFSICQQLVVNYRLRNDTGIDRSNKGAGKPNGLR